MNNYFKKDILKFKNINKLITYGVRGSSSYRYGNSDILLNKEFINTGNYVCKDIVGISINGNRRNRIGLVSYIEELNKGILAGVDFVIDKKIDRERGYNIGEREVYNYLIKNNYIETKDGYFESENKLRDPYLFYMDQ